MTYVEIKRRSRLKSGQLTNPALIHLDYLAPPPDLAPFITTYFMFRCDEDEIADVQPASVGILGFFLRGQGEMFIRDGTVDPSHRASLMTPLSAAAPVVVDGPWHTFGAALSPFGWAALTGGLSASQHGNRLHEAGGIIGPEVTELGDRMATLYAEGAIGPEDMIEMVSVVLRRLLKPVPPAHQKLIMSVAQWLGGAISPRVEDLQAAVFYSPRQLQRLVDQYFGLPPKQLARKYRALRAAALLSNPGTPADKLAMVEEQFYDQSHMIREIRLFAGRTPARINDPDLPVLSALLDLRNFREIKPSVAALPPEFSS
jgi:AraC-like DNA-binding protein